MQEHNVDAKREREQGSERKTAMKRERERKSVGERDRENGKTESKILLSFT